MQELLSIPSVRMEVHILLRSYHQRIVTATYHEWKIAVTHAEQSVHPNTGLNKTTCRERN